MLRKLSTKYRVTGTSGRVSSHSTITPRFGSSDNTSRHRLFTGDQLPYFQMLESRWPVGQSSLRMPAEGPGPGDTLLKMRKVLLTQAKGGFCSFRTPYSGWAPGRQEMSTEGIRSCSLACIQPLLIPGCTTLSTSLTLSVPLLPYLQNGHEMDHGCQTKYRIPS